MGKQPLKYQELRQELIQKVGPWAFQSYSKDRWKDVSDRELIVGVLLKAKPEDRFMLLELYELPEILSVWQRYAVIQDKMFHESNIWAAKHIFKADEPEKFVSQGLRRGRRAMVS